MADAGLKEPILVRRQGGNRLRDADNRRYVSIGELRGWAAAGIAVRVVDAGTGAAIPLALLAAG